MIFSATSHALPPFPGHISCLTVAQFSETLCWRIRTGQKVIVRDIPGKIGFRLRMTGRVTMRKVAQKAGVHVTTVSLALRNHPKLPLATRQRIRAVAERMGYRPDPALFSLAAYRTRIRPPKQRLTLAYLTNWDTEWVGRDLAPMRGFSRRDRSAPATRLPARTTFWLGARNLSSERLNEMRA